MFSGLREASWSAVVPDRKVLCRFCVRAFLPVPLTTGSADVLVAGHSSAGVLPHLSQIASVNSITAAGHEHSSMDSKKFFAWNALCFMLGAKPSLKGRATRPGLGIIRRFVGNAKDDENDST